MVKVKQSHYRPEEALIVPGVWRSQISQQSAREGVKVIVRPMHRPPFPPPLSRSKYSCYSFLLEAVSIPGSCWTGGNIILEGESCSVERLFESTQIKMYNQPSSSHRKHTSNTQIKLTCDIPTTLPVPLNLLHKTFDFHGDKTNDSKALSLDSRYLSNLIYVRSCYGIYSKRNPLTCRVVISGYIVVFWNGILISYLSIAELYLFKHRDSNSISRSLAIG